MALLVVFVVSTLIVVGEFMSAVVDAVVLVAVAEVFALLHPDATINAKNININTRKAIELVRTECGCTESVCTECGGTESVWTECGRTGSAWTELVLKAKCFSFIIVVLL